MANAVLEAAQQKRDKTQEKIDKVLEVPTAEARALTDDESAKFEELAAEIKGLDKQIKGLEKEDERRAKAEAAAAGKAEVVITPSGGAVVRSESGVYRKDAFVRAGEASYLLDLAAYQVPHASSLGIHPEDARRRLEQNWTEVQRDAEQGEHKALAARIVDEARRWSAAPEMEARVNPNTTAGTGGEFVPPLWLVAQYAPFQRAGRVIANRVRNAPLPPGIDVINLPKITTGSLTAIQVANAQPVASQDIVTKSVAASVNTISGQEDISLQLLEQSPLAMDNVVFDDLSRDYDMQLDRQVIFGSGVNGQHRGALGVTTASANSATVFNTDATKANAVTCASTLFWDGTSATSFTQYRSIVNGVTNIELLRFAAPTAIWGHPRRVNSWSLASDAATGRPLYVPKAYSPWNVLGNQEANPVVEGVAGELYGLPVIKDANIPITCATGALTGGTGDVIGVVKEDDMILWEGTMRMRALPEILSGTLQIRFQVYAYSAFLPDRFSASTTVITGTTGLAAPSW